MGMTGVGETGGTPPNRQKTSKGSSHATLWQGCALVTHEMVLESNIYLLVF